MHCDLAARNVLITDDYVLKISDFGLSRKLYSGVYVKDKSKKVYIILFSRMPWQTAHAGLLTNPLDGTREYDRVEVFITE